MCDKCRKIIIPTIIEIAKQKGRDFVVAQEKEMTEEEELEIIKKNKIKDKEHGGKNKKRKKKKINKKSNGIDSGIVQKIWDT